MSNPSPSMAEQPSLNAPRPDATPPLVGVIHRAFAAHDETAGIEAALHRECPEGHSLPEDAAPPGRPAALRPREPRRSACHIREACDASGAALAGKAVIVTGASRGIGAACAIGCAAAGAASVVLIARSGPRLAQTAHSVRAHGAQPVVSPCDVTDTKALKKAITRFGCADILVNCAGGNQPEPLADVTQETFDRLWRLNVQSVYFASQAAAQTMMEAGRPGAIITVSSQMGHVGAPRRSVYCLTKHAVEGLTKALAVELAPHGIRVVSVAPTFVRTEMTAAELDDPELGPALLAQIPLGRFATPEQVAAAVVYAASDAAGSLTGASLPIDGGWTAK